MPVPSLTAAKKICELSGWTIPNFILHKLLYIAHMVHLSQYNAVPLISDEGFEAWDYGPMLPSVYHKARIFGSKAVRNIFHTVPDSDDPDADNIIKDTLKFMGSKQPGELVAITHRENGAWAKNYKPDARFAAVIPNKDILQDYQDRINPPQKQEHRALVNHLREAGLLVNTLREAGVLANHLSETDALVNHLHAAGALVDHPPQKQEHGDRVHKNVP